MNGSNMAPFISSTEGVKVFGSSHEFSFICFVLFFGLEELGGEGSYFFLYCIKTPRCQRILLLFMTGSAALY